MYIHIYIHTYIHTYILIYMTYMGHLGENDNGCHLEVYPIYIYIYIYILIYIYVCIYDIYGTYR